MKTAIYALLTVSIFTLLMSILFFSSTAASISCASSLLGLFTACLKD